jgi:hypothetical protein
VRFREPMRVLLFLRQAGAGWILILPLLEIIQLAFWGGLRDRGRYVYSPNAMLLAGMVPMVMTLWMVVGQYQARLLVSVIELRVPRALRMLCLTLGGCAVLTVVELLAPIVVLHGPYLQWLLFIFYGICTGVLAALFSGSRFETPILFSCMVVDVLAAMGSSKVSPIWVELLAVALPLLIALRLRVLIRALRSGAYRGRFLRSLAELDERQKPTRWRNVDRSSLDVVRVCLGPVYERSVSWILLCFAPLPIMILLGPRVPAAMFVPALKFPALMCVTLFVGLFFLNRVRRLADLLCNPSGEISDLALLPGLGDRRLQRRALLREALIRPLAYYGLCLGGLVGSGWVLVRLSQVPIEPMFLAVPSFALLTLVLFAMLTVGVLSGRLGRDNSWLERSAIFPVLFFLVACLSSLSPHAWTPNPLTWQSIAWATVLCGMAAFLVRWGVQLRSRPNLLRR